MDVSCEIFSLAIPSLVWIAKDAYISLSQAKTIGRTAKGSVLQDSGFWNVLVAVWKETFYSECVMF